MSFENAELTQSPMAEDLFKPDQHDQCMEQYPTAHTRYPQSDAMAVTLAHIREDHEQRQAHANEIHRMRITILQHELAAQKSFWEEKERLLQSEAREKIDAAEEIKDVELKSIAALHDLKAQCQQDKTKLVLDQVAEHHSLRCRLTEEDYANINARQVELHDLKKRNLLQSDVRSDEEVEDDDEAESEDEEDEEAAEVSRDSEDEYESLMEMRSRKRQRVDV